MRVGLWAVGCASVRVVSLGLDLVAGCGCFCVGRYWVAALYYGRYGLCPVFFLYTGVRCSTLPLIVLLRDRLVPIVAHYCAGGFFLHVRLVLSLGGYAGVGLVLRITYNEMQGRGV